jgi:flavin-dependent dehydrogenase
VVVLGTGPAGSVIGANLARAGANVLIFDKAPNNIHVGGEFVPPLTRSVLERSRFRDSNWEESHLAAQEFISSWGSERQTFRNFIFDPHGHALVLNRGEFDRALLAQATSSGAILQRESRLVQADRVNDVWSLAFEARGSRFEVQCGFLVLANGRGGNRPRALGVHRHQVDRLICFGVEIDCYRGDERPCVEAYENGWVYSVRLPSGKLMLNLFTEADRGRRLERSFDFFLAEVRYCPLTSSRILSCQPQRSEQVKFFVTSASSAYRRPVAGPGWCLAGDQAQSMDPLSSGGISQAFDHAERVSEAFINARLVTATFLSEYSAELENAYKSYLAERRRVYSLEKRWNTPFWAKRRIGMAAAS